MPLAGAAERDEEGGVGVGEEAINTPFCPLQEKFHTFVLCFINNEVGASLFVVILSPLGKGFPVAPSVIVCF